MNNMVTISLNFMPGNEKRSARHPCTILWNTGGVPSAGPAGFLPGGVQPARGVWVQKFEVVSGHSVARH